MYGDEQKMLDGSLPEVEEGRKRGQELRSRLECVLLVTFMTVQTQNQGFSEK